MDSPSLDALELRYQEVCQSVPVSVVLVAISKTQSVDAIEHLYHLGHRDFGENYAQELVGKATELSLRGCTEIRWHFTGHLQRNKVKLVLPYITTIHTLDSERLAHELASQWEKLGKSEPLEVFIEVNVDKEESKAGIVGSDALKSLAESVEQLKALRLQGLMCIPAPDSDPRSKFNSLRQMCEALSPLTQRKISMGMSSDYLVAIQEGATHVRLGTVIFGPRRVP